MSAVEEHSHVQKWRQEQGQLHLESVIYEVLHQVLEGKSCLCTIPIGCQEGLISVIAAALQPGVSLLICAEEATSKRREAQAAAAGVSCTRWSPLSESTEETSGEDGRLLIVTEAALGQLTEASQWPDGLARIIWESPSAPFEAPTFWSTLPEELTRVLLVDSLFPKSWWMEWGQAMLLSGTTDATSPKVKEGQLEEWVQALEANGTKGWLLKVLQENTEEPEEGQLSSFIQVPQEHQARLAQQEQLSQAKSLLIGLADLPPAMLPPTEESFFSPSPVDLEQLAWVARRCDKLFLQEGEGNNPAAVNANASGLQVMLDEEAQGARDRCVYLSTSEILAKMGTQPTNQPAFERNASQTEAQLKELQEEGGLLEVHEVRYQAKLFSTHKWNEASVKPFPKLAQFWEANQTLQSELPPFEALKLAFLNGREIDLRQLAQHMPYTVKELNELFAELNERGLLLSEQAHVSTHQYLDKEYQLKVGTPHQSSQAVSMWLQCGEHREAILGHMLSQRTLPQEQESRLAAMAGASTQEDEFWTHFQALLHAEQPIEEVTLLAARVLQWLEKGDHPTAWLLWEGCCAHFGFPGLPISSLRTHLGPAKKAPPTIRPFLRWMQEARKEDEKALRFYQNFALDLNELEEFAPLAWAYLEREAGNILNRNTPHKAKGYLRRYNRLAQLWQEAHPDTALPVWAPAAGWAHFLLDSKKNAQEWLESFETQQTIDALAPIAQMRVAQVALSAGEASRALPFLYPICVPEQLPTHQEQSLQKRLFQQLAEQSKKHSKKLRQSLKDLDTPLLREAIAKDGPGHGIKRIERVIYKLLFERGETTSGELEELATWAERDGDRTLALELRTQMHKEHPDQLTNTAKMAALCILQGDLFKGLEWALEVTRQEPQQYPLESFIERYRERFFSDLNALREALIELPAHPALTSVEEDLDLREQLEQKLRPQKKTIEKAIEEERLGEAKRMLEELLNKHKNATPPSFRQMLDQVEETYAMLRQQIARASRRDKRKRSDHFEELTTRAGQLGFDELLDEAYERLLKQHPQYGLGYLKWARQSTDQARRKYAYERALDLSRGSDQKLDNLQEYVGFLEESGDYETALSTLIEWSEGAPPQARKRIESMMMKLAQKAGTQASVSERIDEFLAKQEHPKAFKKVKKAMDKIEELEPWKRALLSIKTK